MVILKIFFNLFASVHRQIEDKSSIKYYIFLKYLNFVQIRAYGLSSLWNRGQNTDSLTSTLNARLPTWECQNLQGPMASVLRGTTTYSLAFTMIRLHIWGMPKLAGTYGIGSYGNRGQIPFQQNI